MTSSTTPPDAPRRNRAAAVERIVDHAPGLRSIFCSRIDGVALKFIPGQFISIAMPLEDETRTRPYTIASNPGTATGFELCFNRVETGRGAAWMFSLKVGDVFEFTGPIGAFTMDRAPGREAGLIANGTAIAALRPMIYRAISTGLAHPMHLILGADRTEHLVYRSELEDCAGREKLFSFETIIAPDDAIFDALAARARRRWIEADANRARDFWLCGIGAGVFGLRDILRSAGYERRAVRYEKW